MRNPHRDPKDTSPLRVIDVINSCETPEQIETAEKYAKLWLKNNSFRNGFYAHSMLLMFSGVFMKRKDRVRRTGTA